MAALSNDDNGISTSQTPGGAGNLTITGALATGAVEFKTVTGITTDDNTAAAVTAGHTVQSGTVVATITFPGTLLANQDTLEYGVAVKHGLTIVTSSTADITVVSE